MKRAYRFHRVLLTVIWILAATGLSRLPAVAAAEPLIVDADSQFRYAQSRLDSGAFDEAVSAFNRFIYFFPDDARVAEARYQVGMAHFKAARYADAAAVFGDICKNAPEPGRPSQACLMLSRCHARQDFTEQAMLDLHNLIAVSSRPEVIDQARYELGWLHVDMGQWDQAGQAFDQINPQHRAHFRIDALNTALSDHRRIPSKNPLAAGLLSIVPGGGQLYCGRYQDALAAFLINAGLMLSAWEAFDKDLYALGGVISFVEFGFYSGNIYGAVSGAHKFNWEQRDAFRNELYRRRKLPLSISAVAAGVTLCVNIDF